MLLRENNGAEENILRLLCNAGSGIVLRVSAPPSATGGLSPPLDLSRSVPESKLGLGRETIS